MIYKPYNYQKYAEERIVSQKRAGLFLDMGLGKTVITLSAIAKLIKSGEVSKVLIIAPLRVAQVTWTDEAEKWEHLKWLRFSKILGRPSDREKALNEDADIYIINREQVVWLCEKFFMGKRTIRQIPFDMIVIDELSSFKSPKVQRFKRLRTLTDLMPRVVGLTGTPTGNGLLDLWSEIYLLDRGERLGKYYTYYRERYFEPDKRSRQQIFTWKPKPGARREIGWELSNLCVSMKAKDYLELPERKDIITSVSLPPKIMKQYDEFAKEAYLSFARGEVSAVTAGILINKLLQFSNGAVYQDDHSVEEIHKEKLDALAEILEFANSPVLCFYSYKHDLERIQREFPDSVKLETPEDLQRWNRGEMPLALCHPASAGHGLNLQKGGHIIVWFGLPWSLELYQQANARLHRQGQTEKTLIYHIISKGTADEKVFFALQQKTDIQNEVLESLKAKIGEDLKKKEMKGIK